MRAIRVDPISGRPVVIATERLARPLAAYTAGLPPVAAADCPFCPGHEADTGRELGRRSDHQGWVVRAFANRFPALVVEAAPGWAAEGPYASHGAVGAHEVIVEGPDHSTPLWERPVATLAASLTLTRDRMRDLSGDARFAAFTWLRNHGLRAGASQAHPHAQLLALPVIPPNLADQLRVAREALQRSGVDPFTRALHHELREPEARVVAFDEHFVALCPWAPTSAFEIWLVPRAPRADFRAAEDALLHALARMMRASLAAQAAEIGPDFAYNAVLYTAPAREPAPGFRWHVRLLPRTELDGGFERATGLAICGLPPEVAAPLLRRAFN